MNQDPLFVCLDFIRYKGKKVTDQTSSIKNKDYNFSNKDPGAALTEDELANFDEGMKLKNTSKPAGGIDFGKAVRSVVLELDELFP